MNYGYIICVDTLQESGKRETLVGYYCTLDKRMTFAQHGERMAATAKKIMGFVTRNTEHLRKQTVLMTLYALINSIMESGAIIWKPNCYTKMLERMQRRFSKQVYFRVFEYYPYDIPRKSTNNCFRVFRYTLTLWKISSHAGLYHVLAGVSDSDQLSRINIYCMCQDLIQERIELCVQIQLSFRLHLIPWLSVIRRAQVLYNSIIEEHPDLDIFLIMRSKFDEKVITVT